MTVQQVQLLKGLPITSDSLRLQTVGCIAKAELRNDVLRYIIENQDALNADITENLILIRDFNARMMWDQLGQHVASIGIKTELRYLGITSGYLVSHYKDFYIILLEAIAERYKWDLLRVSEVSTISTADKIHLSAWLSAAIWDYKETTLEELFALRGKGLFEDVILCECTEAEQSELIPAITELLETDNEQPVLTILEKIFIKE